MIFNEALDTHTRARARAWERLHRKSEKREFFHRYSGSRFANWAPLTREDIVFRTRIPTARTSSLKFTYRGIYRHA